MKLELVDPCPCGYLRQELQTQNFPGLWVGETVAKHFSHFSTIMSLKPYAEAKTNGYLFLMGRRQLENTCITLAISDARWRHRFDVRELDVSIEISMLGREAEIFGSLKTWLWGFKNTEISGVDRSYALSIENALKGRKWVDGADFLQNVRGLLTASIDHMRAAEIARADWDNCPALIVDLWIDLARSAGDVETHMAQDQDFREKYDELLIQNHRHRAELACKVALCHLELYPGTREKDEKGHWYIMLSNAGVAERRATAAMDIIVRSRSRIEDLTVELEVYRLMAYTMLNKNAEMRNQLYATYWRVMLLQEKSIDTSPGGSNRRATSKISGELYPFAKVGRDLSAAENWRQGWTFVHQRSKQISVWHHARSSA